MKGSDAYQWALIQYPLVAAPTAGYGLGKWVSDYETAYGETLPGFSSGYRNPRYNATLSGSAAASRHMFGDAADLSTGGSQTIWNELKAAALTSGYPYIEDESLSGAGHAHTDWRKNDVSPSFQH